MTPTAASPADLRSRFDEALQELTRSNVVVPDPEDVWRHVARVPAVLPLVSPIAARARLVFPEPAQLSLEMRYDYETGEPTVCFFVRVRDYRAEPVERWMEKTFSVLEPFVEEMADAPEANIIVTTDHCPPR